MVTDATKKYRELMAYGLIAVAVLVLIGSLSLLFKSGDDVGPGIGFAEKSALFGTLFESVLPVLSLVAAVILVTRLGELSANARVVVLAALGIAGLDLLFALITFFAQFAADSGFIGDRYAGVSGAGKAVGVILGLAQLLFLVIALGYFCTAFQSLPAPAAKPVPQWGGGAPGFGSYGAPNQQGWAQPGQGYGHGQQQSWGQQGSSYGWAPPGDSQPPGWGQQPSGGGWGAPAAGGWPQQPGYGAPPAAPYPIPPTAPTAPSGGDDTPPRTGSTAWEPPSTAADPGSAEPGIAAEETPPPNHESGTDDPTPDRGAASGTVEDQPPAGEGWWQHPGSKPSDR